MAEHKNEFRFRPETVFITFTVSLHNVSEKCFNHYQVYSFSFTTYSNIIIFYTYYYHFCIALWFIVTNTTISFRFSHAQSSKRLYCTIYTTQFTDTRFRTKIYPSFIKCLFIVLVYGCHSCGIWSSFSLL